MKAIDNKELEQALILLEKEKGIEKKYLLESIETALVTAYKRNYDSSDNVKVTLDEETGETHIYAIKEVAKRVTNPILQISMKEAQKINPAVLAGETIDIEIVPKNFGRIAAQTAKQVIIQKLREAERNLTFGEFNERKGEILSGIVQKADTGVIIVDLGKLEGIMPKKEQIPSETYKVNDKIKGYVVDVVRGNKGNPQVIISRACPDFVKKLFQLEIPEIYEGLIEVKSVARDLGNKEKGANDPGSRCKVAVASADENIDPVGSCVGQKGVRIQNIINELHGEKIDVIEWNEDPSIFIASALLPAQVMAVDVNEEEKQARVIVKDDQLSLAIGKSGQNARLAARLTGWKIDIKSETQFREMLSNMENEEETEKQEKEK